MDCGLIFRGPYVNLFWCHYLCSGTDQDCGDVGLLRVVVFFVIVVYMRIEAYIFVVISCLHNLKLHIKVVFGNIWQV